MKINFFNAAYLQPEKTASGDDWWAYDWYVRAVEEREFNEFADELRSAHVFSEFKQSVPMWSFISLKASAVPTNSKGYKRNDPALFDSATALVLDYDSGISIQEFCSQNSMFNFILYSTHSHKSDAKNGADCFRVIVELSEPIPWDLLKESTEHHESILKSLTEAFPHVDESCFQPERAHFLPSSRLGCKPVFVRNSGVPFNWLSLERTPKKEPKKFIQRPTVLGGDGKIQRSTLDLRALFVDQGWTRSERENLIEVICPNADQHSGPSDAAKLVYLGGKWNFKCQHTHCGATKFVTNLLFERMPEEALRPYCETILEGLPELSLKKTPKRTQEPFEISVPDVPAKRIFSPVSHRDTRKSNIRRIVGKVLETSRTSHFVIQTAEGYGKSTNLVRELLRSGKQILFCCLSNEQANSKTKEFELYGAARVWSKAALLEARLGISAVYHERSGEWDAPELDEEATIEVIVKSLGCSEAEAEEAMAEIFHEASESRKQETPLLVTTFATGNVLFDRVFGKLNRVVVVDDPSLSDLNRFVFDFETVEGQELLVVKEERKSEDVIFGKTFIGQSKIIWTTTEDLVRESIALSHDARVFNIQEHLQTGGKVLAMPTKLVRKKLKQVVGGIHNCVQDFTKEKQHLISNGRISELNLVSTKGRNDLQGDAVIVLSYPHPLDVAAVARTLGLDDEMRQAVAKQMVVDVANQAIGRGQGCRDNGSYCLILVDPGLDAFLRQNSRYEILTQDGVNRKGRLNGCPIVWHEHLPEFWAYWFAYIKTWERFVVQDEAGRILRLPYSADIGIREAKLIDRELDEPIEKQVQGELPALLWKKLTEVVPGESRKNFSVVVSELVQKTNKDPRFGKKKSRKKAVREYLSPEGEVCPFNQGDQPRGWKLVRK